MPPRPQLPPDARAAGRAVRAALAIAGRPVAVRALATAVGVGLPAAIVFSPQGLDARTLVHAMGESTLLRAIVWAGWIALSSHASNVALTARGITALRSARPRRAVVVAIFLGLASVAQLPWAVLWWRGAGAFAAAGGVSIAIALSATSFAIARRRSRIAGLLALLAVAGAAMLPALPAVAVGLAVAPLAVDRAMLVAHEHGRRVRRWTRPTASAVVALATVHLLRLARAERFRLLLAAMVGAIGTSGLFTLRSDPSPRPIARALAIMGIPFVVGGAVLVAPLVSSERGMSARLRALRVGRSTVAAAFFLALVAPTSAFAATSGIGVGLVSGVPPASLAGSLVTWAVLVGVAVGAWGRWHDRTRDRSAVVYAVGVAGLAIVAVAVAMAVP